MRECLRTRGEVWIHLAREEGYIDGNSPVSGQGLRGDEALVTRSKITILPKRPSRSQWET